MFCYDNGIALLFDSAPEKWYLSMQLLEVFAI